MTSLRKRIPIKYSCKSAILYIKRVCRVKGELYHKVKKMGLSIEEQREKVRAKKEAQKPKPKVVKPRKEKKRSPDHVPKKARDVAYKYRKILLRRATREEKMLKTILLSSGYSFYFQKIIHYGKKNSNFFIVDFMLRDVENKKIVIEVDGSVHSRPEVKVRDLEKDNILGSMGMKVLRFTNYDIHHDIDYVLDMIEEEGAAKMEDLRK